MSEYHDVTVIPGSGIIPIPGDDTFKFNRYYIAINPDPANGPPTWRISDPDEFPCGDGAVIPPGLSFNVAAVAPLIVSEVTGGTAKFEYSFNIGVLPEVDQPSSGDSITLIDDLDAPVLLSNRTDNPVISIYDNNDKTTVSNFDIYHLRYVEWAPSIRRMKTTVYNSNRSGLISTVDPVQSADNVDTTDLFFDIDSLPHET
jgi:hypothetical protein